MSHFQSNITSKPGQVPPIIAAVSAIADKYGIGYSFKPIRKSWWRGTVTNQLRFEHPTVGLSPAVADLNAALAAIK